MLIANNDPDLAPWLFGVVREKPHQAGGFLTALAEVAFLADLENYWILRPALLQLKEKYPKYRWPADEAAPAPHRGA